MNIKLELLIYIILFYVCYQDIKTRLISNYSICLLIIYGLFNSVQSGNIEKYYIGMSTYPMVLIFIYCLEDLFNKELIGFGDIKLMIALGGIFKYESIIKIVEFYKQLFLLSGIIAIIYIMISNKIKNVYIPFAPLIILNFILVYNGIYLF